MMKINSILFDIIQFIYYFIPKERINVKTVKIISQKINRIGYNLIKIKAQIKNRQDSFKTGRTYLNLFHV